MLKKCIAILLVTLPQFIYATLQWAPLQWVPTTAEVTSARLAVSKNSSALVAWYDAGEQKIKSSDYHFLTKEWTPAKTIPTRGGGDISLSAIHFSPQGKAALAWFDASHNSLSVACLDSNQFDFSKSAWTAPVTLELPFPAEEIQSIFDPQGNLSVVWTAWNGLEQTLQGSFYSHLQRAWSPISDISPISMNSHSPKIAVNEKGQGVVVWQASLSKSDTGVQQTFVQAATFSERDQQWSKPLYFGYDWTDTVLSVPDVAIDQSGNIAIIWEKMRPDYKEPRLQYVRYLAKKNQWTYVSELESGTVRPQFGKNPQNIQITWSVRDGTRKGLNIAQFDIENNLWYSAQTLAPYTKEISNIQITSDPLGKLNLAWLSGNSIHVTHFDKGWTPAVHLDKNLAVESFDLANDGIGNVLLTSISGGKLMYSIGNYLLPPDFFEGKKVEVHYATRKVNHGHLTWSHAESPNALGYIIKRDGVVMAVLPIYAQQYTDYRCPSRSVCYELTVVNVDNIESLPVKRHL